MKKTKKYMRITKAMKFNLIFQNIFVGSIIIFFSIAAICSLGTIADANKIIDFFLCGIILITFPLLLAKLNIWTFKIFAKYRQERIAEIKALRMGKFKYPIIKILSQSINYDGLHLQVLLKDTLEIADIKIFYKDLIDKKIATINFKKLEEAFPKKGK